MTTMFMSSTVSRRIAYGAVSLGILLVAALAFAGTTTTYSYDALGRLRTITKSGDQGGSQSYDYDAAGNRTQMTSVTVGAPAWINAPPANSSTGSYTLSWTSVVGAQRYELYEATNASFSNQSLAHDAAATSKSIQDKINGSYYYRVRACDATACGSYLTGLNPTVVSRPAPGVPGSVVIPPYSNTGSYLMTWGAASGWVTAYEVLELPLGGTETLIYNGPNQNVSRSGKPDNVYSYRVRACNGTGCSAYNATAGNGGVIYVDKIAPTPPTTIQRVSPDYTFVWSGGSTDTAGQGAGSGVGSWNVYRNGSWIGSSNYPLQSFRDVTPPTNVTLNYTIRSVDRAGNVSIDSPAHSLYVDTIPPTTPGNFRATSVTTGSVTLAWDASTDAFGISWYRIARSGSGTVMGNGDASTTYVDNTVASNATYTYQIFAVDGHGVESAPASVTVTTPTGAPAPPVMNIPLFVRNKTGSFVVSWSASTGAANYRLNENGSEITLTTTSKSFSRGNGEYAFSVRACSAAGLCSGYSATKTVIVCIGECQ